jgi:hypothetical protein
MKRLLSACLLALGLLGVASLRAWSPKELFAQGKAEGLEVNSPDLPTRILIATQGSAFKRMLSSRLVEALRALPSYVRIVDLSELPAADEAEWSAILVASACESSMLHPDAEAFVARAADPGKVLLLATSGSGRWKPRDCRVDCLSSASRKGLVDSLADEILGRFGVGRPPRPEGRQP